MAEPNASEFLLLLKKSGLLSASQEAEASEILKQLRTKNAEVIAAEFVRKELLTQWQADQLLKGQSGFVLQQYQLLSPVGKGGMGHVFRARDIRTGSIVAIKVMSRRLTGNQTLVSRFRREIRASSLLNNPHIVRTLDAGRVGKVDFMVMEYVNGDQLDRIAARLSALPTGLCCDIIRQVAVGLQHAHEQKMVHRDIKPANLIVDWSPDGSGTVKIMDMGLVRLGNEGEEQTTVTRAGQVMGTPDYMSPEQGWNTATVDIRSDIYSLGLTFFRLLTGRIAFPGDNPLQVLMARCSRDAPSAKGIRPDLPEAVDQILRRMTLRDPAGRFQSPYEVAEALSTFCEPLTADRLRTALRESGNDDAVLLEPASSHEAAELQDAGYQQFLREMDSGAVVDLMTSTNGDHGQALSATLPILTPVERRSGGTRRLASSQKSGSAAWTLSLSAGTLILLIGLAAYVYRDTEIPDVPGNQPVPREAEIPNARLAAATLQRIQAGSTLTWQPQFEGAPPQIPAGASLEYRLGTGAPAAAKVDARSGQVVWDIPETQAPAEYDVPVELSFTNARQSAVISSVVLPVIVERASAGFSLVSPEPAVIVSGEKFHCRLQVVPAERPPGLLKFRLGSDAVSTMEIDAATGEFSWTPGRDDSGRNQVTVELVHSTTQSVAARATLQLLVRPDFELPAFPEQTAEAGATFRMKLMPRVPAFLNRGLRLRVSDDAPAGVEIDLRRGELSWKVPSTSDGKYRIPLILESGIPKFSFPPQQTVIVVNVSARKPNADSPAGSAPDPDAAAMETAAAEIREVFRRDLAALRSVADRAQFARTLLEKAIDQKAGPLDTALLDLILETAGKGRAVDVALEAARLKAERYAIDEVALAVELTRDFRAQNSNGQVDAIIENCLRVARDAAVADKFPAVAALLTPPATLLKKSEKGTFAKVLSDDVETSLQLANELSKGADDSGELRTRELTRLLQKWQFETLFSDPAGLGFVESGGSEKLPDGGRSLWEIEKAHISLTATSRNGNLGILDLRQDYSKYLLRFQLSSRTTSAALIFGAGRDQNLAAHLMLLDKPDFGRTIVAPGGSLVWQGVSGDAFLRSVWNEVEILADGTDVRVRVNGTLVTSIKLPALTPGRLGLLVPLEKPVAPTLEIRRPRVLNLSGIN